LGNSTSGAELGTGARFVGVEKPTYRLENSPTARSLGNSTGGAEPFTGTQLVGVEKPTNRLENSTVTSLFGVEFHK